jgi:hypothetical protein
MYDRDAMRRQLCSKEFQSQIHDTRASHKQPWQAGWERDKRILLLGEYGSACRCARHRQPLGWAVLGVYPQDSGGETDRLRVTVRQEQPVLA